MARHLPSALIQPLWQAIEQPGAGAAFDARLETMRGKEWIEQTDLDAMLALAGLPPHPFGAQMMAALGMPARFATERQTIERGGVSVSALHYAAADVAALIVILEGLGLAIDPSPFVAFVSTQVARQTVLNDAEATVHLYPSTRAREVVEVASGETPSHRQRIITAAGYRVDAGYIREEFVSLRAVGPLHTEIEAGGAEIFVCSTFG